MVPNPSGTADLIENISSLYSEFHKSGETHLTLCEAPQKRYYHLKEISLPWSGARSFIYARCCAILCQLHRGGWTSSWASQVKLLHSLNQFFLLSTVSCSEAHSKVEFWAVQFRGKNPPFLLLQVLESDSGKPCCDFVVGLPGVSEPWAMLGRSLRVLWSVSKSSEAWKHSMCSKWDLQHLQLLLKAFGCCKQQAPWGQTVACSSPVYCESTQITSGLFFLFFFFFHFGSRENTH